MMMPFPLTICAASRNVLSYLRKITLPLAVAAFFVAGCSNRPTGFAPHCARVEILKGAADYFVHTDNSPDPSRLITQANITALHGDCAKGSDSNSIATRLFLTVMVQQGPAATSRTVKIPYFVAILHNGEIRSKKEYIQTVTFPDNVSQLNVTTSPVTFTLPVTNTLNAAGYQLEIGFQLTQEQLDYNRKHIIPAGFSPQQ